MSEYNSFLFKDRWVNAICVFYLLLICSCINQSVDADLTTVEKAVVEEITEPFIRDITVEVTEDESLLFYVDFVNPTNARPEFFVRNVPGDGTALVAIRSEGLYRYTPDENYNGKDFFRIYFEAGGEESNIALVTINVTPVNDVPEILAIGDMVSTEETAFIIPFMITDVEDDPECSSSSLSMRSSNESIVSNTSVIWGGLYPNCTATIFPELDQVGDLELEFIVSDSTASSSETFDVLINNINDAPVISMIPSQNIDEDEVLNINFTLTDIDSFVQCNSSNLLLTSTNTSLIDSSDIEFSGTAPNCMATITPKTNQFGVTTLEIEASDGALTSTAAFVLIVNPVNDAPELIVPQDLEIFDTVLSPVFGFLISDPEQSISCTANVTASSSNSLILQSSNITIFDNGPLNQTCEIQFLPELGVTGLTTITLEVSDGINTTVRNFDISVIE